MFVFSNILLEVGSVGHFIPEITLTPTRILTALLNDSVNDIYSFCMSYFQPVSFIPIHDQPIQMTAIYSHP